MKTMDYKAVASNPGAAEQNVNAQKQFAAWLVHFGLAIGTIKKPMVEAGSLNVNSSITISY